MYLCNITKYIISLFTTLQHTYNIQFYHKAKDIIIINTYSKNYAPTYEGFIRECYDKYGVQARPTSI